MGFTPCGACRPNETLALSAAGKEQAESTRSRAERQPARAGAGGRLSRSLHRRGERAGDHQLRSRPVTVGRARQAAWVIRSRTTTRPVAPPPGSAPLPLPRSASRLPRPLLPHRPPRLRSPPSPSPSS